MDRKHPKVESSAEEARRYFSILTAFGQLEADPVLARVARQLATDEATRNNAVRRLTTADAILLLASMAVNYHDGEYPMTYAHIAVEFDVKLIEKYDLDKFNHRLALARVDKKDLRAAMNRTRSKFAPVLNAACIHGLVKRTSVEMEERVGPGRRTMDAFQLTPEYFDFFRSTISPLLRGGGQPRERV